LEHEQFISGDEEELKHIREKKLAEFKAKKKMKEGPIHLTDSDFDETLKKYRWRWSTSGLLGVVRVELWRR